MRMRHCYFLGFEYWANPANPSEGYVHWVADGHSSHRMGAGAVGPDQGEGGSGVGQRLIPEEPMSIVLNLAISESFQTVDTTSMTFPSEMKIDYIRVYQRSDAKNVGCDPDEYPTAKYIESHLNAYMSMCCISFFPLSSFLH